MMKNNEALFVVVANEENEEDVKIKVKIKMNDNIWHEIVLRETHKTEIVNNCTDKIAARVYSGVGAFA